MPAVRKNGDRALPRTMSPSRATSRSVSQRASRRVHDRRSLVGATVGAHRLRSHEAARWSRRRRTASALTATRMTSAVDRLEPELGQADEDQRVRDEPEEQGAERRAGEGPGAAEDADAADDDGGHDLSEHAARRRAVDRPELDDPHDPGHARPAGRTARRRRRRRAATGYRGWPPPPGCCRPHRTGGRTGSTAGGPTPITTTTTAMTTKIGMPRMSSWAASVKPGGRPDSGPGGCPAIR